MCVSFPLFAASGMTPLCIPIGNAQRCHLFPSAPSHCSVSPSSHSLESEALIKSERQEARSHEPVLERSSSKGREGLSL